MVGGVLVERTVKDVIPALDHNLEQVSQVSRVAGWTFMQLLVANIPAVKCTRTAL